MTLCMFHVVGVGLSDLRIGETSHLFEVLLDLCPLQPLFPHVIFEDERGSVNLSGVYPVANLFGRGLMWHHHVHCLRLSSGVDLGSELGFLALPLPLSTPTHTVFRIRIATDLGCHLLCLRVGPAELVREQVPLCLELHLDSLGMMTSGTYHSPFHSDPKISAHN